MLEKHITALENNNIKLSETLIKLKEDYEEMSKTVQTNKVNINHLSTKFKEFCWENFAPGPDSDILAENIFTDLC